MRPLYRRCLISYCNSFHDPFPLRKFAQEMKIDRSPNSDFTEKEKKKKGTELLSDQFRHSVASSEQEISQEEDLFVDLRSERNSKLKSKAFSRLFSDLSLHLRVIDDTCSKYQDQESIMIEKKEDLPPRHSKSQSNQTNEIHSTCISPPPPPPLLLASPKYSPNSRESSVLSPLTTPTPPPRNSRRHLQDLLNHDPHRELFPDSSVTETTFRQSSQRFNPCPLDSPSSENTEEKKRFHTATHFLVPGGLSTNHPSLSPQSPTTKFGHQNT